MIKIIAAKKKRRVSRKKWERNVEYYLSKGVAKISVKDTKMVKYFWIKRFFSPLMAEGHGSQIYIHNCYKDNL